MKKTIFISIKNFIKKMILIAIITLLMIGSVSLKIPHRICQYIAKDILFEKNNKLQNQLSDKFSLKSGPTVYAAMPFEKSSIAPKTPATKSPADAITETPVPTETPQLRADLSKISAQNVQIKNHTNQSVDVANLLQKPISFQKNSEGYKVLLVHTHTTESYFPNDRSQNPQENMISIGEEFQQVLEENGIKTLHITTVHDVPYTTSYKKSLESVTKALKENPSIEVVIDLHRDAIIGANQEKVRPLTTINGVETAQVMLVCGTGEGGLPHPHWKENLSFALKVQGIMQASYPNFARPLDLRVERFNTHTTKNSVIFEIGSHGNTLEEAKQGAKLAAQAVADVLNSTP
ncbi:MAG: hypothetical protein E7413_02450 [Ruminococcaceae bacterium]|nr:hypothetical protein [Oscillospiraceae bacterium]